MCYSAEVSFATWGFGMACAAFLYLTGHPVKSFLLPLVVVQMQLVEGLRWLKALPEPLLAWAGKLAIYAQPIAAMIEGGMPREWMVLYAVVQTVMEALFGSRDTRFVVADDGHFKWNWIWEAQYFTTLPYALALLISTYVLVPFPLWAALWALYAFYTYHHNRYGTQGSLWCVAVNLGWLYYILR